MTVLIITNQSVINGDRHREALDSLHRKMIRDIARPGEKYPGSIIVRTARMKAATVASPAPPS